MNILYDITTTYSYWKLGTGNPFSGGCCGYDLVAIASDGTVVGRVATKPVGAVDITEAEWNALQAAITAHGEQIVADGEAWLAAQKADENALLVSARSKLVAGIPLSVEEAAIITRGLQ